LTLTPPSKGFRLSPWEPIPFQPQAEYPNMPTGTAMTFSNITPGRYGIDVPFEMQVLGGMNPQSPKTFGYLADIRQDGRSVIDSGIVIGDRPPAPIDLVFEEGVGAVHGVVLADDMGVTFAGGAVDLIPVITGRRMELFRRRTLSNGNGQFLFSHVVPGDYVLFATVYGATWDAGNEAIFGEIVKRLGTISVRRGEMTEASAPMMDSIIELNR
jgi:hypothetical protein